MRGSTATFSIEGALPGLNEYTRACRAGHHPGAAMKREAEQIVGYHLLNARLPRFSTAVTVTCTWWEKDERRDPDNVCFAVKFILDALVKRGVLPGDSRRYVKRFTHEVATDRVRPHIDVTIAVAS